MRHLVIPNKQENLRFTCKALHLSKSYIIKISSRAQTHRSEKVAKIITQEMMLRLLLLTPQYQHKQYWHIILLLRWLAQA
jgi:hypothetical protein